MQTIYLATDHAGLEHKNYVRNLLESEKYTSRFTVVDCGAFMMDATDDYPDWIPRAIKKVSKNPASAKAIIFGGSGQGEAIVANKYPNIQAIVYYGNNADILSLSRQHNDANVLSIGARMVKLENLEMIVDTWLDTEFTNHDRHIRRLSKIRAIEKQLHSKFLGLF